MWMFVRSVKTSDRCVAVFTGYRVAVEMCFFVFRVSNGPVEDSPCVTWTAQAYWSVIDFVC